MSIEHPKELYEFEKVLEFGATKYGPNTWLRGEHFNPRDNHASICRHVAEGYCGITADAESGLHPYLHAACRLLMEYTMWKRSIEECDNNVSKSN